MNYASPLVSSVLQQLTAMILPSNVNHKNRDYKFRSSRCIPGVDITGIELLDFSFCQNNVRIL